MALKSRGANTDGNGRVRVDGQEGNQTVRTWGQEDGSRRASGIPCRNRDAERYEGPLCQGPEVLDGTKGSRGLSGRGSER